MYELLGGPVRESVRVYKWIGAESRENLAEQAEARVDEGLRAVKFSPTPEPARSPYPRCVEEVKRIVRDVRAAVGPEVDIMLDPASRWKFAEARHVLSELERFDPLFAEDFVSSTKHIVPGEIEDGRIPPPEEPGLGVSVSDELFEQRPVVPDPPLFVGDDFHVPEW